MVLIQFGHDFEGAETKLQRDVFVDRLLLLLIAHLHLIR